MISLQNFWLRMSDNRLVIRWRYFTIKTRMLSQNLSFVLESRDISLTIEATDSIVVLVEK